MRVQTNAPQDSTAGVNPATSWRVADVQVLSDYRLKVRFRDGTEGTVDMSRLILSEQAGVFSALRDPASFAQARVEYGAVTWPGELDLAPDAMYQAIKQSGTWTPV